jgi:hypothetical protein
MTYLPQKLDTPKFSNLKKSNNYRYDSSNKIVFVDDNDFNNIVSVYNSTLNKMLFILNDEILTGTIKNNSIAYDLDVSGAGDNDDLVILYNPLDKQEDNILKEIKQELKKLNKVINKIYK